MTLAYPHTHDHNTLQPDCMVQPGFEIQQLCVDSNTSHSHVPTWSSQADSTTPKFECLSRADAASCHSTYTATDTQAEACEVIGHHESTAMRCLHIQKQTSDSVLHFEYKYRLQRSSPTTRMQTSATKRKSTLKCNG